MIAYIYSPAKSAAQAGKAGAGSWLLRYAPQKPKWIEPLMGWTSASDPEAEVKLRFKTQQEAVAFAEKNGIAYQLDEPPAAGAQPRLSYADNFRADRKLPWTH